jgi:hypothetical protein
VAANQSATPANATAAAINRRPRVTSMSARVLK